MPHRVVIVVFDDFQLLDLAGPVEVLKTATFVGAEPGYEMTTATAGGRPVRAASGISVNADISVEKVARSRAPVDTLVVVGGLGATAAARDVTFCRAVQAIAQRSNRVTSICTGAIVLAAAGLLDGYQATTHWASCDRLADDHPAVTVHPDRIYVHDRDRWTSAGVTAGIDLFLAIVEHDHGPDIAHAVAGWLVVFAQRPGGQSQFSVQLRAKPASTPMVAELQRWIPHHLDEDLSIERMAEQAGTSARSLARMFPRETGATPAAYVEALRVEEARRLFEATDMTVAAVAASVGLKHAETLHRAFRRQLNTTPDSYRQHFTRRVS